jgi:hypothetical protein
MILFYLSTSYIYSYLSIYQIHLYPTKLSIKFVYLSNLSIYQVCLSIQSIYLSNLSIYQIYLYNPNLSNRIFISIYLLTFVDVLYILDAIYIYILVIFFFFVMISITYLRKYDHRIYQNMRIEYGNMRIKYDNIRVLSLEKMRIMYIKTRIK